MRKKSVFKTAVVTIGLSLLLAVPALAEYTCTYPGGGNSSLVTGTWSEDGGGTRFTAEDGQVYADHWLYYKNTAPRLHRTAACAPAEEPSIRHS